MNEDFETPKESTIQDLKQWIRTRKEPKKIEIFDFNNVEIHEQTPLEYLFYNDFLVNFDDLYCHVHISENTDYNQIFTRYFDNTYKGTRFWVEAFQNKPIIAWLFYIIMTFGGNIWLFWFQISLKCQIPKIDYHQNL